MIVGVQANEPAGLLSIWYKFFSLDNSADVLIQSVNQTLLNLLEGKAERGLSILEQIDPLVIEEKGCRDLILNLRKFIQHFQEGTNFINALAEGNLDIEAPHHNYVISHYKQLQSNLRHLTWQTQQIARGDYNQKVVYLGDFSIAFNKLIEDLREKKQMQDELRDLYATREKFMSIISHDLKSPFNGILGFADILQQDYDELPDEERKQYIAYIQGAAKMAFKLLENLLDWSRSQTGKIRFTPEELNLSRLVLENFLLLRPVADNKQIHLYTNVPADAIIFADKNAVLTILRNLLNNAIKFTHPGGKVKVSAAIAGGMMEIAISDTGIGISPENIQKLFKLGENFKTEGTQKEKGTGLGLLLCKEFVEKNGGSILAESQVGKGSRFVFTLPVFPDETY